MTQVNVSQQLKAEIGTTRSYQMSEVMDIGGDSSLVHGEIRLMRTDRGIMAKGTLHARIELTCSRCLSLFRYPLTLDIEEEYFPTIDIITGNSISLPDEPECFTIDEHNILDLTEAIRQYALLATPMKPLCRTDCAGLCPVCGRNLNQADCDCPAQVIDPRWSKLRELVMANQQSSVMKQKGTN
ncbi:MAG: DUF177 domain-containing protein [Dehalococcoidales bacterium]|nr:DUF177 domain-containing protein [Dehalococcoidales bacterium]